MSPTAPSPAQTEGRRASRIDAEVGGRYVAQNSHFTRCLDHQPVRCPENRVRYSLGGLPGEGHAGRISASASPGLNDARERVYHTNRERADGSLDHEVLVDEAGHVLRDFSKI